VVSTWEAMRLWTPEYILQNVPYLKKIKRSTHSVFILAVRGRSHVRELPEIGLSDKKYQIQNISTEEFLHLTPSVSSEYLYYFGEIDAWADIKNDIHTEKLSLKTPNTSYTSATSVFMGHPGVIAQCHHDRSHNFFAQIYGKKKWILYPPSEWENLYLYPYLHAHYQQSQIHNWSHPDLEHFPKFSKAQGYEVPHDH
jgi:hypothetical protein